MADNSLVNNDKVGYVILHYNTVEETKDAVNSIVSKNGSHPYEIIIVDNASPNGSGAVLKQEYDNIPGIHVIINQENKGFACGNNTGFRYAKDVLNCSFICLLNNDTMLVSDNFSDKIISKYEDKHYWVLGPDIVSPSGIHQNPQYLLLRTPDDVKAEIGKLTKQAKLNNLGLFFIARDAKNFIKKIKNRNVSLSENTTYMNEQENTQLSGAFWVMSPDFVNKYSGLNEGTFLYREEDILYHTVTNDGGKMLYSPDVVICHVGQVATNSSGKTTRKKMAAKLGYHLQSLHVLEQYMNEHTK